MRLMTAFRDKYLWNRKGCSVLDVGSRNTNGSYRRLFEEYQYLGMDVEPGRNVMVVGYENLGVYDVVISGQVMEHVRRPWEWLKNLTQYFRDYICIIAPNTWEYHPRPIDAYRYFPDGMADLFDYAGITPLDIRAVKFDTIGIGVHHARQTP